MRKLVFGMMMGWGLGRAALVRGTGWSGVGVSPSRNCSPRGVIAPTWFHFFPVFIFVWSLNNSDSVWSFLGDTNLVIFFVFHWTRISNAERFLNLVVCLDLKKRKKYVKYYFFGKFDKILLWRRPDLAWYGFDRACIPPRCCNFKCEPTVLADYRR